MIVNQLMIIFLFLWIVVYLVVSYIYYHTDNESSNSSNALKVYNNYRKFDDNKLNDNNNNNNNDINYGTKNKFHDNIRLNDPFLSLTCQDAIDTNLFGTSISKRDKFGIIMISRNEDKFTLVNSVKSIFYNSGVELKQIIIVDDNSNEPIVIADFAQIALIELNKIDIIRTPHRLGTSGSKAYGVKHCNSKYNVQNLVFLDSHVIVSKNWLLPIGSTLDRYPKSIAYPVLDIITVDNNGKQQFIKAHNVVGGFDWSLMFRWESLNSNRINIINSIDNENGEILSPATPGIMAIKSEFYNELGGFDTSLKEYGNEHIEFSIRAWLCGGVIFRQSCSRVGHYYDNVYHDSYIPGVKQGTIDLNNIAIAEHLFKKEYKELVYQARFTNRIPYKIILDPSSRMPKDLHGIRVISDGNCQSFDWYLQEIYPGLIIDSSKVQNDYSNYINSDYLDVKLNAYVINALPSSSIINNVNENFNARLQSHIAKIANNEVFFKRNTFHAPVVKELPPHEKHVKLVKDTLACVDEDKNHCESLNNDPNNNCISPSNRYYMMFSCPHTCNLCGSDGKICFDYFEKKCVEWKAQGLCDDVADKSRMHEECRYSCGLCSRPGENTPNIPNKVIPNSKIQLETIKIDPFVAQKEYSNGILSEPIPLSASSKIPSVTDICQFNNKPHGQLLNIITTNKPNNDVRLFCGIYTMEKNHETNVRATKLTWAKKCTGFIAFSTVEDLTIPSVKIEHEGEESYDNMWQKSRSIWKYISQHYINDFDYFLLGGDDMFYIIENLQAYLQSDEIKNLKAQNNGIFIGRRFQPPNQHIFNSGGAGYILDNVALNVLKNNIDSDKCYAHQHGFWEDVNVANCLRVGANILPYDTRDSLKRERFHPFTPGQHLTYRIPKTNPNSDWYPKYNPELKEGFDCCSSESISFHYCGADILIKLYNYYYHCNNKE